MRAKNAWKLRPRDLHRRMMASPRPAPWTATWGRRTSAAVLIAMVTQPCGAQTITLDTLSLHRLPGVRVEIEPYANAARDDGLDPDSLRHLMESKLVDAGIAVLTEDEWQVTIGNPLLLLRIDLLKPSDFFYLYALRLELKQLVVLARDSTIPAFSATWTSESTVGSVQTANLPSLRWRVADQVDRFIAAHAAADRAPYRWVRPVNPRDTIREMPPISDPAARPPGPGNLPEARAPRGPARVASGDQRTRDRVARPNAGAAP